ncbi:MAG: flagellar biosynthesis protein FlgD [Planctomycetes bacterium]|nr:flagellar biosynthesis protein FlgD [Planctomycetota bacterium]
MPINDISAALPSQYDQVAPKQQLDKDAFMKLLVTQMKSQDPLSPQSNQEFIGQLANFSSLEQMQNLNDNVLGLALLQQDSSLLLAMSNGSALIGKDVVYEDPATGATKTGHVESMLMQDGQALLKVGSNKIPLASILEIKEPQQGAPTDTGDDAGDSSTDAGNSGQNGNDAGGAG